MRKLFSFVMAVLSCASLMAQSPLESKSRQPQWGDGSAPVAPGTHIWQVKNDTGQTWVLHGISFFADTGNSQITSVSDDMGNQLLSSGPITGTLAYAPGTLVTGASLGYGHFLVVKANFDGVTTRGQADIAVTHNQVDGTETAAFSSTSLTSPVSFVDGCWKQYEPVTCSLADVTAGGATVVTVVGFGGSAPTLVDNGNPVPSLSPNTITTPSGLILYVFTIANETAGSHTYTASFPSEPSYPSIFVATFSGASTTSPFEGIGTNDGPVQSGTGGAFTCPAVQPTSANEYVGSFATFDTGGYQLVGQNLTLPSNKWRPEASFAYAAANGNNLLFLPGRARPSNTTLCVPHSSFIDTV